MPELSFSVRGAAARAHCLTPTLALRLVIDADPQPVAAVALDCQVRIDAQRRRYSAAEKERLAELFGAPERWGQTLRSLLWTQAAVSVPPFEEHAEVDLELPCTSDFNVLAGKYFNLLDPGGSVPLSLLFSGSVFYRDAGGLLQVTRIPWSAEATFQLEVQTWRDVLALYYPNTTWVGLRQDVFDALYAYRVREGCLDFDDALTRLLEARAASSRERVR